MKVEHYICDMCKQKISKDTNTKMITLNAFAGSHGGLLLPHEYLVNHFCNRKCFLEFVKKDIDSL